MRNPPTILLASAARLTLALAALAMLSACGDDGGGDTTDTAADTGVTSDAEADTGTQADTGAQADTAVADTAPEDTGPPVLPEPYVAFPDAPAFSEPPPSSEDAPAAPETELEPVEARWLVTFVSSPGDNDPVGDALAAGTFTMPEPGAAEDGQAWYEVEPSENGALPNSPFGFIYGAAQVDVPEGQRLIARADRAFSIFANGREQPGDVYGSGRHRVPLVHEPGEPLTVVLQGYGQRGAPSVGLFATSDEVVFNTNDATTPTPVAGEEVSQWLGVQIVVTGSEPVVDLVARVLPTEDFAESAVRYAALPGGSATQVGFELIPARPMPEAESTVTARLRIASPSLGASYEKTIELTTMAAGEPFRRTFRSRLDGSAQFYGVRPPREPEGDTQALVLSLHGAGVGGLGQARAYSSRDWAWLIAPTNRRPFGFDWEVWGRLDGLEVLDHASKAFPVDPTRVYLTGHSMGGHGTWQLGVLYPGRFALMGPSAGWSSFYSYTGRTRPGGPFARSQASSDTNNYLSNLARRSVYIIHGDADTNVPVREGRDMFSAVSQITDDVTYHEQPGAGHWWNGDVSEGADCVDWQPMFETMNARQLDPYELDFDFVTPSPQVSPTHSYITVRSQLDPWFDSRVSSTQEGDLVRLTTDNVRSLVLYGDGLLYKGIRQVVVDDDAPLDVVAGPMAVGPQDGKRPGVHGPFNEALYRPFCFIYDPDGPPEYAEYAAFLTSNWSAIGNGHACALPLDAVTDAARARYNFIYLGVSDEEVDDPGVFSWDAEAVTVGENVFEDVALAFVLPGPDGHLDAVMTATAGSERLLFGIQPFTSSFALPDFFIWSAEGGIGGGFFTPDWTGIAPAPE